MQVKNKHKSYVSKWTIVFPNLSTWLSCSKDEKILDLIKEPSQAESLQNKMYIWNVKTKERHWYSGVKPHFEKYKTEAYPSKHYKKEIPKRSKETFERCTGEIIDIVKTKVSKKEDENDLTLLERKGTRVKVDMSEADSKLFMEFKTQFIIVFNQKLLDLCMCLRYEQSDA